MKKLLSVILLCAIALTAFGQSATTTTVGIDWADIATKIGLGGLALIATIYYVIRPIVQHSISMQERLTASNELMAQQLTMMGPTFNNNLQEAERRLEKLIEGRNDELKEQLKEILTILKAA
jgi:hypothetical protein